MAKPPKPPPPPRGETIRELALEDEMKASYLTYAMSVIVSRALPDVRDGLKPSQRRILVAANDLNLGPSSKFRKCAKICGDTTGNYHPHGDQVVYPTMVRLAQDFVMRYRLVDGQGNFGTVDGDPPAAMRYTEARLTRAAVDMLEDLDLDTVDQVPNYDERLLEPTVLPSRFPNLLCNGASGIAVGMATNIPPHNVGEIASAVTALIGNPDLGVDELLALVPGPDFPTGALLCGTRGVRDAYSTGRGTITVRARAHTEEGKDGRQSIVVTEIPYLVNRTTIIERIAELVKEDQVRGVSDIRDESDREGSRLVIELKKGEDATLILNQLYKHTPLQDTFGVNMIALVDGRPVLCTLKELLAQFIRHRETVLTRRTRHLLGKAEAEAHILEGLRIAIQAIDEVIATIKRAPDPATARTALMARFKLSEPQADAILQMRLSRLTALEVEKIDAERAKLAAQIAEFKAILSDRGKLRAMIVAEMATITERYGDKRRTEITGAVADLGREDLIADEEMVVTVSAEGYVKRLPVAAYRRQQRGGKGVTAAETKSGDAVSHVFIASTHDYLCIFTDRGRLYWLKVYDLPELSRYSRGRAIVNLVSMREDERLTATIPVRTFDDRYVLVVTEGGTIKKTVLAAYGNPKRGGIIAQTLDADDRLVGAVLTSGNDEILLGTRAGMGLRFHESDVRPMGRTANGVRGIALRENDKVVGLCRAESGATVLTVCANGYGKRTAFEEYRRQRRGGIGLINIRVTDKNGPVAKLCNVRDADEMMLVTTGGMVVRTPVGPISVIGRATQGVRLIALSAGDTLASVAIVAPDDAEAAAAPPGGAGAPAETVAPPPPDDGAADADGPPEDGAPEPEPDDEGGATKDPAADEDLE